MNTRTAIAIVILFLMASVGRAGEVMPTDEENRILTLVLKGLRTDGGYTVVNPTTGLFPGGSGEAKDISKSKRYLTEHFKTNGIVVTQLVDRLFERNKKPARLTLKSSPGDGHVIDVDGKYAKYFEKEGGGWEKWYKDHPKAHGLTTVSLPVYEEKTGLVLVYTGTQSHRLAGSGWVILYRYEDGKLKEINRLMMWIS